MRADARRHREALVDAAVAVFERDGYDAPLESVIAEAKLGRGTLYRHFADRGALIIEIVSRKYDALTDFVEKNIGSPNLLVEYIRHQSLLSIHAIPALHETAKGDMSDLTMSLLAQADILNKKVADQARTFGIVHADFDAVTLRVINRMISVVVIWRDTPDQYHADFETALAVILEGIIRVRTRWP